MFNKSKQNNNENILYNKILTLSRNKLFYSKLNLVDSMDNRINLIFLHISFLFVKVKNIKENEHYKLFSQRIFDLIFKQIELNLREIGHGDVMVNKKMKLLVKFFYSILFDCENYRDKKPNEKSLIINKYLAINNVNKSNNTDDIVKYFDKYEAFCLDLSSDSVLKGEINFNI